MQITSSKAKILQFLQSANFEVIYSNIQTVRWRLVGAGFVSQTNVSRKTVRMNSAKIIKSLPMSQSPQYFRHTVLASCGVEHMYTADASLEQFWEGSSLQLRTVGFGTENQ